MSEPRIPGWIYVLASQSHPGIVKIGRTSRHTPGRMIEVDRSAYAAFGPWTEVWSRAVADCAHVEAAAHRMLANRRVKLNRLVCRELFRVDSAEACRVVEAAAGSLIVARQPLPVPMRRPAARFRRAQGTPAAACRGGDRHVAGDGLADRAASARMMSLHMGAAGSVADGKAMAVYLLEQQIPTEAMRAPPITGRRQASRTPLQSLPEAGQGGGRLSAGKARATGPSCRRTARSARLARCKTFAECTCSNFQASHPCASLASIGRAIFGHSDEPSAAGLILNLPLPRSTCGHLLTAAWPQWRR